MTGRDVFRRTIARRGRIARAAVALVFLSLASPQLAAETLVFHGSVSGQQTLDDGEGGGNPFASALIEALSAPLALSELAPKLKQLTARKSQGLQIADVPASIASDHQLVPPSTGERRMALVMVVSSYSASGAQSLPGARHDADRIAQALRRAGFQTEIALDLDLGGMRKALSDFKTHSREADAAVIYTTGHGLEVNGAVFLLPGDYPIAERNGALAQRALPLAEITRSPDARKINLVFYAGCRDNPFGP